MASERDFALALPDSLRLGRVLHRFAMPDTYSVTEAQSKLPSLLRCAEAGEAIGIRRRDETVAFLVSRERMEAIVETLEILGNPDAQRALEKYGAGELHFSGLSALDDER